MNEKCSKCFEVKPRSEFTKLNPGSKPKCIACVEKKSKVEKLKSEIERTSAKLFSLKQELKKVNGNYIPKEQTEEEIVVHKVKKVQHVLTMHPYLPIGMKKGVKDKAYFYHNGAVKAKSVWDGKWGKYTSYKDPKTGDWKYIGMKQLEQECFGNDSRLGISNK